jgi:hypothetical protein
VKRPLALTKLIHVLDRLFDTVDSSKMIVTTAGIEDGTIEYSTASVINWTNIVNEALKQDALERLVDAAVAQREDAAPELRALLRSHQTWTEHHRELAAQLGDQTKPPTFFEIFRFSIIVGIVAALLVVFAIGFAAAASRHTLLGLPVPFSAAFAPGEWGVSAAQVLLRIPLMLFEYAGYGFGWLRALLAIGVTSALIYFVTLKRPPRVQRFYVPKIVIPLLVLGAAAKVGYYDVPTLVFRDVLTKNSITDAAFDIPPAYARQASRTWKAIVCSRIASSDDPRVRYWCREGRAGEHRQNALGRYLLNVAWTSLLTAIAIAVIRKLAHTSRQPEWNVTATLKRLLIATVAMAGLATMLFAAQTYARTVAPTVYDLVRPPAPKPPEEPEPPFFRVCAGPRCFKYIPSFGGLEESPDIATAPAADREDILTACFESQLDTLPVDPAL